MFMVPVFGVAPAPASGTQWPKQLRRVLAALEPLAPVVRSAKSSWYKPDFEIQVARDAPPPQNLVRLSELSAAVRGLTPSNKQMVYVAYEHARDARRIVKGIPPG